ncbi:hypothetical protein QWY93_12490 [Echinicola jeungdonensis]|uniref:Uncharacterized protein n=1 Tax=Echinicola jeungdonensis TaxID=709343 RepID=A0ABV5J9J1_9BACT|nr:hypothetical protein [Echinicola jeungdonensis]MDN3670144.1 hypothetical protein [Echinicola jeungdonensis]
MQTSKLEKTVESVVEKLQKLKVNDHLVSELQWCLGSYRNDNNPSGLLEKGNIALVLLKQVKEKNSRSVSKKLIEDLEKAVILA